MTRTIWVKRLTGLFTLSQSIRCKSTDSGRHLPRWHRTRSRACVSGGWTLTSSEHRAPRNRPPDKSAQQLMWQQNPETVPYLLYGCWPWGKCADQELRSDVRVSYWDLFYTTNLMTNQKWMKRYHKKSCSRGICWNQNDSEMLLSLRAADQWHRAAWKQFLQRPFSRCREGNYCIQSE